MQNGQAAGQDEPDCEKRSAERSGVVWNHMESAAIPCVLQTPSCY